MDTDRRWQRSLYIFFVLLLCQKCGVSCFATQNTNKQYSGTTHLTLSILRGYTFIMYPWTSPLVSTSFVKWKYVIFFVCLNFQQGIVHSKYIYFKEYFSYYFSKIIMMWKPATELDEKKTTLTFPWGVKIEPWNRSFNSAPSFTTNFCCGLSPSRKTELSWSTLARSLPTDISLSKKS